MTLNPEGRSGRTVKKIKIKSNDPKNPLLRATLISYIIPDFGFEKKTLSFGKMKQGEVHRKTAKLITYYPEEAKIREIKCSAPWLSARVLKELAPGKYEIEVTAGEEIPAGRANETLTVFGTLENPDRARLRITGMVSGDIEINPAQVTFKLESPEIDDLPPEEIVLRGSPKRPFQIIDFEDQEGRLELELEILEEGSVYRLKAWLAEDLPEGERWLQGTIQVQTDAVSQKEILIPYRVVLLGLTRGK